MWYKDRFFKYITGTILVLLTLLLISQLSFLIQPIINFIETLFFPLLLAGILYYALRPVVQLLERYRIPRLEAILLIYLFIILFLIIFITYAGPIFVHQIKILTTQPEGTIQAVKEKTVDIMKILSFEVYSITELRGILTEYLYKINNLISNNIVDALTTITRFAVVLLITPFVLFYFLKDDRNLYAFFMRSMPIRYQRNGRMILNDMDKTLSMFITGQILVAVSMGCLLFIGYLIIGLQGALVLAFFATFFFTIPIIGTFIAIIPALVVALSDGSWMALKVLIVLLSVVTLEGNFISPQIMAQRLHIHPVITILVLLASGSLYGVLGLFLATPVYALVRVLTTDFYRIYREQRIKIEAKKGDNH